MALPCRKFRIQVSVNITAPDILEIYVYFGAEQPILMHSSAVSRSKLGFFRVTQDSLS